MLYAIRVPKERNEQEREEEKKKAKIHENIT